MPFTSPDWKVAETDQPCSGCGECCKQLPCEFASIIHPCLFLHLRDGRFWCALVENETPGIAEKLLIGRGCGATMIPSTFKKRNHP